jgi:DNA-directed RNA polymerase subunit M/transcription elongation factor TFIIS
MVLRFRLPNRCYNKSIMSSSAPVPSSSIACPACGQKLAVRAEDRGRKGKCLRCGEVFRIEPGEKDDRNQSSRQDDDRWEAALPVTLTFSCELCATRLTARVADVGRPVKCPDCGRRNIIPPPAPLQAPKKPAAMTGAQYALWDVDDAPPPDELAAKAAKLHPVECQLCQTLMYATDAQLGKKFKCPDCGALTVAHARPQAKPTGPTIVPDGEEYQLDEASPPTPRPFVMPRVFRQLESRAEDQPHAAPAPVLRGAGDDAGGASDAPRRKTLGLEPPAPRPEPPAVPLIQGVALYAVGCIVTALWSTAALPLFIAIVVESSEGNDRLQDPPRWTSFDWFAELGFFLISAAMSALPAWLTTKFTGDFSLQGQIGIAAGTWLFCFPIALLSGLEQSSPFAVVSPRLIWSLVRCAGPWLLFYLETGLLAAAVGFLAAKIVAGNPWMLLFLLPWLIVTTLLIYMRLLGRLAWWIAEMMPSAEEATPT